jgi:hypothetical protein
MVFPFQKGNNFLLQSSLYYTDGFLVLIMQPAYTLACNAYASIFVSLSLPLMHQAGQIIKSLVLTALIT